MERGKTSGRTDDNIESLKKRFVTYIEQTMPIIEYYQAMNKVKKVDANRTPDEVSCFNLQGNILFCLCATLCNEYNHCPTP